MAVVSPSWCAPAVFPALHEQALGRIEDLDPARIQPKRFLGYSDNSNLANWLWFHGIGSV